MSSVAQPPSPSTGEGQDGGVSPETLRRGALGRLDFAIAEFRAMKMQPSLERALGRKGIVGA
jgi:hypothetical protein